MPDPITLIADDGRLYTPFDAIVDPLQREWFDKPDDHPCGKDPVLVVEYPSGEHDTIPWPLTPATWPLTPAKWVERLRSALFDAREMGLIPDVPSVRLPDGTVFLIDVPA